MATPAPLREDETPGTLVTRARDGDQNAWNALVRRYTRMLLRIARATGLDEDAAQDVAQVTWLQLAQQLDAIREPEALGGWLATIARRESLRLRRLQGRERPAGEEMFANERSPERVEVRVMTQDRDRTLRRAFELLGERCRQLLTLLIAEVPYTDISTTLDMPIGSIGPTRQRCLGTLRARAQDLGLEP